MDTSEEMLDIARQTNPEVTRTRLDGIYEPFIMGEGEYPMEIFACIKS